MAVPEAPRLFQRAIIQSAPLGISRGRAKMNHAMGIAAESVTEDTPAMDVVAVEEHVAQVARKFGMLAAMPFGTQYGHDPLPDEADIEAAWDRTAPGIEVLIGHTSQEARLFLPRNQFLSRLEQVPLAGKGALRAVNRVVTEAVYGRASRRFARRHAAAGGLAHHYVLDWHAPDNVYGSAHTIDLPLLFGQPGDLGRGGPDPGRRVGRGGRRGPGGARAVGRLRPRRETGCGGQHPGRPAVLGSVSGR